MTAFLILLSYLLIGLTVTIIGLRTGRVKIYRHSKEDLLLPIFLWPVLLGGAILLKFADIILKLGRQDTND